MSDYLDDCWKRFKGIAKTTESTVNPLLKEGRNSDAKRAVQTAQADLRELKRDITEAQRVVRASATAARQKNAKFGQTMGMFMGSKGRGALSHGRAAGRRSISSSEQQRVRAYDELKYAIDQMKLQLDRLKADITADMQQQRETARPQPAAVTRSRPPRSTDRAPDAPPPPPPPTPAQWAPDPFRRHELRYWDGTRWTDHVADQGEQGIDPAG